MNDEERIDRELAQLPRSVAPPRDLWPDISARLAAPPAGRIRRAGLSWPHALAAGLALVAVTALVTDLAIDARRGPGPAVLAADPLAHANPASQAKLVATRRELKRSFEERLPTLSPTTRAAVLHSLAAIQQAQRELESALRADPDSTLVRDLLETTWQKEYALYDDVVRSTDNLAVRT